MLLVSIVVWSKQPRKALPSLTYGICNHSWAIHNIHHKELRMKPSPDHLKQFWKHVFSDTEKGEHMKATFFFSDTKILTSHEEEKPRHILHKASIPTAPQHPDNPSEEDDGHSHAHEASCHPAQICSGEDRKTACLRTELHKGLNPKCYQNAECSMSVGTGWFA